METTHEQDRMYWQNASMHAYWMARYYYDDGMGNMHRAEYWQGVAAEYHLRSLA